ncbi:uncharacterized protein ColSpa_00217 [Colletotrichum spaethianum]|uniref:Uncharacterized protein n=1 Tax=Colletotrichum spaethianum TaxID=700344 RepID=A0AA37L1L9_9PEZI|nr:uncharacterized protein ColSpa_00217 [Colletotrichum spaethianum]GKT40036.1 hypothetical protein ColSpa_00217 [Colletotrichum spaethianum]
MDYSPSAAVELELLGPLGDNGLLVGGADVVADGRGGGRLAVALHGEDGGLDPALDAAVAPVGDDGHGGGVDVGDAAAAEAAAFARDLDEEVGRDVAVGAARQQRRQVVRVRQLLQQLGGGRQPAQEQRDGGDGVLNVLGRHGVEQHEVGVGLGGGLERDEPRGRAVGGRGEDDAGGVEQGELAVDLDGADARRDAGLGARGARLGGAAAAAEAAEEGVDDGGLSDVGVADDTDRDGALELPARGVRLERAEQVGRRLLHRQLLVVEGVRVGRRVGRAQGQRREVAAQVHEPVLEDLGRHEVDLVDDEDEALAAVGGGHDAALNVAGAGGFRVAGVEHVEDDVGLLDNVLEDLVERLARGGVADGDLGRGVRVVRVLVIVVVHLVVVAEVLLVALGGGPRARQEGGHGVRLVDVVLYHHVVVVPDVGHLVLARRRSLGGAARLGGLCHLAALLRLLLLPQLLLLNLLEDLLLVGEQVRDAGVLLELGPPFRVLFGELSLFPLLGRRRLFDLMPEADGVLLDFGSAGAVSLMPRLLSCRGGTYSWVC